MKKFMVYLDDGQSCYKVAVPAKDKKDAIEFCNGNGEVICVKDVTEEYPLSLSKIAQALMAHGFSVSERDFILRTLARYDIAE